MEKYFFVAFKAFKGKYHEGGGGYVVGCSCSIERMDEALLDYYNGHASHKADKIVITSLTVLDKKTAAQLSNNFTNGALIIDDGEKEVYNQVYIERWIARDKDGTLYLYFGKNPPKKEETEELWGYDDDSFIEIDGSLYQEVKWSDEEPTNVKLVIDK